MKSQYIRVVDVEDAHVGAAPGAALLGDVGDGIEGAHKGDRAAGDAAGRPDDVIGRAQAREREAGAAAALVDEGGELDGVENLLHGVVNRQDEASGELPELAAGVHECRGVGQELQPCHQAMELLLDGLDVSGLVIDLAQRRRWWRRRGGTSPPASR